MTIYADTSFFLSIYVKRCSLHERFKELNADDTQVKKS